MIPQMLTPIRNCQSAGATSVRRVPCIGTPALLQAMWSLPKLRSASASASSTDCSCVTSIRTGMTRLLVPERPCAAASTASFWMSAITTLAPASASAVAMPRPMPEAAPVTIAVLPEMSIIRGGPFGQSMKVAAAVDDDGLAGHRLGAAHRDDHVGAIVFVGGLFEERGGGRVLDELGAQIGGRAGALEEAGRDAVDQRFGRQGDGHAFRQVDEARLRDRVGDRGAGRPDPGDR